MRNLEVYIECNGNMINVGSITGHNSEDAVFSYSEEYIEDKSSRAISISLPLDERSFSPERTRCFFESLLPEGYTRRCVAGWLHVDENDYISVLSELGSECLGAIRIVEGDMNITESSYRLLSHEELLELQEKVQLSQRNWLLNHIYHWLGHQERPDYIMTGIIMNGISQRDWHQVHIY